MRIYNLEDVTDVNIKDGRPIVWGHYVEPVPEGNMRTKFIFTQSLKMKGNQAYFLVIK